MKTYQDSDSLHGYGKAIPKAKRPTLTTPRPFVMMVRRINNHNGPLYKVRPRDRRDGSVAMIRVDCCSSGHANS